jgi:hypothetical protein
MQTPELILLLWNPYDNTSIHRSLLGFSLEHRSAVTRQRESLVPYKTLSLQCVSHTNG